MPKFIKTVTRKVEVIDVEIDWKGIANAADDLVMKHHNERMQIWKDERDMRIMFLGDAQDSLAVCDLLAKGSWKSAKNRLDNMDTAARDLMYDIIELVAGAEFFDHVR